MNTNMRRDMMPFSAVAFGTAYLFYCIVTVVLQCRMFKGGLDTVGIAISLACIVISFFFIMGGMKIFRHDSTGVSILKSAALYALWAICFEVVYAVAVTPGGVHEFSVMPYGAYRIVQILVFTVPEVLYCAAIYRNTA